MLRATVEDHHTAIHELETTIDAQSASLEELLTLTDGLRSAGTALPPVKSVDKTTNGNVFNVSSCLKLDILGMSGICYMSCLRQYNCVMYKMYMTYVHPCPLQKTLSTLAMFRDVGEFHLSNTIREVRLSHGHFHQALEVFKRHSTVTGISQTHSTKRTRA